MRTLICCFFLFFIHGLQAQPQANFSADTTEGCAPLQVNFNNLSTAANQYQWKFGDGNGSSNANPAHLYINAGVYSVSLIATSSSGVDSLVRQQYINVHEVPQIDYSLSDTIQCLIGDSISFYNQGDTSYSYRWSFGDGNGSQQYEASYSFSDTGFFQTSLRAESPYGCQNTYSINQQIRVKSNPAVDFLIDTSLVCQRGVPVRFNSLASSSLLHYWDFGDGKVDSSLRNTQHLYQFEGLFDVRLTVEDSDGCQSSEEKKEAVRFHLPSPFSPQEVSDTVCSGQTVNFIVDSNWTAVQWNFGDGGTANTKTSQHKYLRAGSYQASVTVIDSMGCKQSENIDSIHVLQSPIASFVDTSQVHCLPFSVGYSNSSIFAKNYQWTLGNLNSIEEDPVFTFTQAGSYDLQFVAMNDFCADTMKVDQYYQIKDPFAEVVVDDSLGCAPHTVLFTVPEPSRFNQVRWFFGNGDSARSKQATYTYEKGGKYRPYVITETNDGCMDTAYYAAQIEVENAQFVFNQPDTVFVCRSGIVDFNGESIGGESWQWDFGDGDESTMANPSHLFDSAGVFEVKLLTENTLGCYYNLLPYNVVVVSDPTADFTSSRNNCPNFEMRFNATDTSGVKYLWDFGDGVTDSTRNPIHYYSGPGFYNVSLSVWYPNGCFVQKTKINAVQLLPCIGNDSVVGGGGGNYAGAFSDTLSPIIACAPFQLDLRIPDDSLKNIWWDFGDGNFSTSFHPNHIYRNRGNYTLQMIIEDNQGQFDTVTNHNYIQLSKPTAAFDYQIINSCNNSRVSFLNRSTYSSEYQWKLGSSGVSKQVNPMANYSLHSNELIELKAIDSNACFDQLIKNLSLGSPNPYFDFDHQVCLGDTVLFASNIKNYQGYSWQIGAHFITGDTVQFVAQDTGEFSVRIHLVDQNSCSTVITSPKPITVSNPQANFVFNGETTVCDYYDFNVSNLSTGAEEFMWLINGADTLFDRNPNHRLSDSGVYSIQLVASKDGCVNYSDPKQLTVNQAVVDFDLVQTNNCLPIQVQFTDRSKAAIRWQWDFGDGDSSMVQHPQHTFIKRSTLQRLQIVDSNGCRGSIEKSELQVHQARPTANQWEGCIPLTVQFADSSQGVVSWRWSFGDGDTSRQQFPQHVYNKAGSYDVSLITQSAEGCFDTTVLHSAIVAGEVTADFSTTATANACAPHMVIFENHSEGAVNYQWTFGDGKSSIEEEPIHVYHKAGVYDVSLIADDGYACTDTIKMQNRFNINTPEVDFTMTDSVFCGVQEVDFVDLSKRVAERRWFLGDGNTSTAASFSHTYEEIGLYTVSLVVTDTAACVENLSKTIRFKQKPIANFSLDSTYGCVPATIGFRNQSSDTLAADYIWKLNQHEIHAFDTTLSFNEQAAFDVSLTVNNSNGCADTMLRENHLKIYEAEEFEQPIVKQLSRNERGDWLIQWVDNNDFNFMYYQLYRKNSQGKFVPYVKLWDQSFSTYQINYRADWKSQQCFKVELVKHCSDRVAIDSIKTYCSIDLEATKEGDNIHLNWSPYPLEERSHFELFRKKKNGSSYEKIAIIAADEYAYLDSTLLCPEPYIYQLKFVSSDKSYTVSSDTAEVEPDNLLDDFEIDLKRITVVNNHQVLIEWEPLSHASEIAHHLYLSKRNSRGQMSIIKELPLESSAYVDTDVNASKQQMEYKLSLANRCRQSYQVEGDFSSLWLEMEQHNKDVKLRWTEDKGLKSGVNYYLIQQKRLDGSWETIKRLEADEFETEINLKD